jgi:hypothetical protein
LYATVPPVFVTSMTLTPWALSSLITSSRTVRTLSTMVGPFACRNSGVIASWFITRSPRSLADGLYALPAPIPK